jgi:hypothetical protein
MDLKHDPSHWRQRAAEMRATAQVIDDVEAKKTLLKIADDYDRLADQAIARLLNIQKDKE